MNDQQLLSLLTTVIDPKSKRKAILNCIHLHYDQLTFSDFDISVTVPYESGIEACIPCNTLKETIKEMVIESFSIDAMYVNMEGRDGIISIEGDNPKDYPPHILTRINEFNQVGEWGPKEIALLKEAYTFRCKDEQRPAMTGIFASKNIVAVDGDRLYWKPIEPMLEDMIVPARIAQILISLGDKNWRIFLGHKYAKLRANSAPEIITSYGAFIADDGIIVAFRLMDAPYPNYEAVIPKDDDVSLEVTVQADKLIQMTREAIARANKRNYKIVLTFNGAATIKVIDRDGNPTYQSKFEADISKHTEEFNIALNGKLLVSILQQIKGKAKFKLWKPTRATVINDSYLLVPLTLPSNY